MLNTEELIGGCGAVGVVMTILPTILLIVSEVLGLSKGKSNGIVHFGYCILNKIKNKEPINSDEIFECIRSTQETVEAIKNPEPDNTV